jgi:hypothetical protein
VCPSQLAEKRKRERKKKKRYRTYVYTAGWPKGGASGIDRIRPMLFLFLSAGREMGEKRRRRKKERGAHDGGGGGPRFGTGANRQDPIPYARSLAGGGGGSDFLSILFFHGK